MSVLTQPVEILLKQLTLLKPSQLVIFCKSNKYLYSIYKNNLDYIKRQLLHNWYKIECLPQNEEISIDLFYQYIKLNSTHDGEVNYCYLLFHALVDSFIPLLEWLLEYEECIFLTESFDPWQVVIYYDKLISLQWLTKHASRIPTYGIMDVAARYGRLRLLKYIHLNYKEGGCSTSAMNWSAEYGHIDVVVWLHRNRTEGCTSNAIDYAAANGHLNVVQFLTIYHIATCTRNAMDLAARGGYLEIVKFLHYYRTEGCTTRAMDLAAQNGHLHVVRWLHHNRREGCSSSAMYFAAQYGHLDIVKFLFENRTEGKISHAIDYAFFAKQHRVAKYLLNNFGKRRQRKLKLN